MKQAAAAVLELDKSIWQAQQDAESPEFISQARDIMRDMIVLMAAALEASPKNREECLDPLVVSSCNCAHHSGKTSSGKKPMRSATAC